jgi:seryl-tRNA synthetase
MIDIKLIRENPGLVKENIKKKFQDEKIPLVDKVKKLDEEWRKLKYGEDKLRSERNVISKKINELKKAGKSATRELKEAKSIPDKIARSEDKRKKLEEEIRKIMLRIPNIIHKGVPIGKDESENVEIRKWGKIPKFSFPVKNHVELIEKLNAGDFDVSAKVSGKGFYYLKNELALLNQALIRFGIDFMKKKGYEYIETPLMLNEKSIYASMDRKAIEESVYSIEGEDLNLIGTAEQSLLAMHSGDTISESDLPKKYFSYSMCFRKEIGAHGINEKGLWRTHQFNKVEQFIFCKPEDSEKLYNELLKNSEDILKELELPYRVLQLCSGDLADWKYQSADLEVWRPTTNSYGEVVSLSNCTDYQARKLDIKCIDKKGNRRILHTLNDTALATSRILVAILENNQQKDGSVKIPKVLWKYTGFRVISPKEAYFTAPPKRGRHKEIKKK